jgi:hypothetical protein
MGMFLVSFVTAEEDPTFQFNTDFDLKRGCSVSGFFCGPSFTCNITLVYPDSSLLRDNVLMGDQGSYRNISIPSVENNQLGFMRAIQSCNNGSNAGFDAFDVAITADGRKFQVFPTQFVIIILGFLLVGAGFITDRMRLLKIAGSMLLMVMGVLTIYPGYSFMNYSNLMGWGLGVIIIGIGAYFLLEGSFSRDNQDEHFDPRGGDPDNEGGIEWES